MTEHREKINYHSLAAILTFFALPLFWFLSVPAILFSSEAKKFDSLGAVTLARCYSHKSKKYIIAAWLTALILSAAALVLFLLLIITDL